MCQIFVFGQGDGRGLQLEAAPIGEKVFMGGRSGGVALY